LLLFLPIAITAQEECGTTDDGSSAITPRSGDTSCGKLVSVNIHFVLRDDGTGNYTETTDPGGGTSENGYTKAQDIVDRINQEWMDNQELWRPTGNTTPVENINIQYDLKGVYFDRSTTLYNEPSWDFSEFANYAVNSDKEINIFFIGNQQYSGIANGIGDVPPLIAKVMDVPALYDKEWGLKSFARTMAHEIGHLLGLSHPSIGDGCADTWDNPHECYQYDAGDPICGDWDNLSNTFMDQHAYQVAVSPCQIERMHGTLEDEYQNFYTCLNCPTSDFLIPTSVSGCQGWASSGVTFTNQSENVDSWRIEIWKTSSFCTENKLDNYYNHGWNTGPTPSDLTSIYPFATGNTYRVTFSTKDDCGYESQSFHCVYIQETCGGFSYSLMPNPVENELTIDYELKEEQDLSFSIVSAFTPGPEREIFMEKRHPRGKFQHRVDVSRLRPGIHYVRAKVGKYYYMKEFVISRN